MYNGSLGTFKALFRQYSKHFTGAVDMDGFDEIFRGKIYNDVFGVEKPELHKGRSSEIQSFDYGYVISCHKSQGSSWERVCVIEEACSLWDSKRWLYTAITRAEKELLIVTK